MLHVYRFNGVVCYRRVKHDAPAIVVLMQCVVVSVDVQLVPAGRKSRQVLAIFLNRVNICCIRVPPPP